MMTVKELFYVKWRPIVSEVHAACLFRRELKHHVNWKQRVKDSKIDTGYMRQIDPQYILLIKPDMWYLLTPSFFTLHDGRRYPYSRVIGLRDPVQVECVGGQLDQLKINYRYRSFESVQGDSKHKYVFDFDKNQYVFSKVLKRTRVC